MANFTLNCPAQIMKDPFYNIRSYDAQSFLDSLSIIGTGIASAMKFSQRAQDISDYTPELETWALQINCLINRMPIPNGIPDTLPFVPYSPHRADHKMVRDNDICSVKPPGKSAHNVAKIAHKQARRSPSPTPSLNSQKSQKLMVFNNSSIVGINYQSSPKKHRKNRYNVREVCNNKSSSDVSWRNSTRNSVKNPQPVATFTAGPLLCSPSENRMRVESIGLQVSPKPVGHPKSPDIQKTNGEKKNLDTIGQAPYAADPPLGSPSENEVGVGTGHSIGLQVSPKPVGPLESPDILMVTSPKNPLDNLDQAPCTKTSPSNNEMEDKKVELRPPTPDGHGDQTELPSPDDVYDMSGMDSEVVEDDLISRSKDCEEGVTYDQDQRFRTQMAPNTIIRSPDSDSCESTEAEKAEIKRLSDKIKNNLKTLNSPNGKVVKSPKNLSDSNHVPHTSGAFPETPSTSKRKKKKKVRIEIPSPPSDLDKILYGWDGP